MIRTTDFFDTKKYILENEKIKLELLSYGARIHKLYFGGIDVVLGFDTLEDYQKDKRFLGATVGRYANRIAGGEFMLGENKYTLSKNENGITTLHGGEFGFDRFEWDAKILDENSVCFERISPDGEMGFPGELEVSVTYTLSDSAVIITYTAKCDGDTVFNPTNHAYFNLGGLGGKDCREMILQLNAEHYLPIDENLIPTGEIKKVDGTEFDFQDARKIGVDFDHCFVLSDPKKENLAGFLYSEESGIKMNIETDLPGIQLYTCEHFTDPAGKENIPLHDHHGVALETQFSPNSPNCLDFPSPILKKGEEFQSITKYSFEKI